MIDSVGCLWLFWVNCDVGLLVVLFFVLVGLV